MKKILLTLCTVILVHLSFGQNGGTRVLFLGNSYTNANNLPNVFQSIANAQFDTVFYTANTPGGYTMELHTTNMATLNNIALANWDYVVIQEQSQRPSFPNAQVNADVFPYAKRLDSLINVANSCTETVFYMTWGRQNGDANNCQFFTPLCTYQGMDSMLNLRYKQMAERNAALVSPVGAVWNYIRSNYPAINLYSSDGSHPSALGTYAAACTFYTTIFRKDPNNINYYNTTNTLESNQIKAAVKAVVYDSLTKWNIGKFDNKASFIYSTIQNSFQFESQSPFMPNHLWKFGDGSISNQENPNHMYATSGFYSVIHEVINCGQVFKDSIIINFLPLGIKDEQFEVSSIYPNPTKGRLKIESSNSIEAIKIYSLKGEVVFQQIAFSTQVNLDLSELLNGVYFLEIENSSGQISRKKIVKIN